MIDNIKNTKFFIKIKPSLLKVNDSIYDSKLQIKVSKDRFINLFKEKPKIMSIENSINYIIEKRCSISRFGDGEMKLICGKSIFFQPYSKEISSRLREVLRSKENNHIIGIPDVFGSLKKYDEEPKKYWSENIYEYRYDWYSNLDMTREYANSFISRCYMAYKNKDKSIDNFNLIKKLWDKKDIVIIEGVESRLGIGNDLFDNAKSIERILGPKEDAFRVYDGLMKEVKKVSKDKVIFLALGPTATIMAYDLTKLGYQAIDIGHIDIEYEWFLRKSSEKVAINNKYVGEAKGGQDVAEIADENYLNQIIMKVY